MDQLNGAAAAVQRAGVLARGLSQGRRSGCRLAALGGAACATDLRDVLASWPLPADVRTHPHGLAACVALQASPTKEAVAELGAHAFTMHELAALQLCEGAAALGWVHAHWPGLSRSLDELTGGLQPTDWQSVTGAELAAGARRLARERDRALAVPAVLGALPLRLESGSVSTWLRRRFGARLRVLGDALERLGDQVGEPIAVEGSEEAQGPTGRRPIADPDLSIDADGAGPGIPFPEWDEWAQAYRHDFTRVVEFRSTPRAPVGGGTPAARSLDGFFRLPIERRVRGRLADGADIDIDGVVDALVDARAGPAPSERLYRDRIFAERDVACLLLIDCSGSLAQAAQLEHELACADALVDAMDRTHERHAVLAFWSNGRHQVALNLLQDFGDRATRPSAAALRPTHHTRLGAAIRGATVRLVRESAARHVLLILTDGVPFDDGYEDEYARADVAKAVEEAERDGVVVAVLAVSRHDRPALHDRLAERMQHVGRLADLAPALGDLHARLVA